MAEPEHLTHETLRRLQGKLDDIQSEMRLRFTGVETGLTRRTGSPTPDPFLDRCPAATRNTR